MDDLSGWRKQIDEIDEKLLQLLAKRIELAFKIGQIKKQKNISIVDKSRWQNVLSKAILKSEELDLSKDFIKKLFNLIHKYSIKIQKEHN